MGTFRHKQPGRFHTIFNHALSPNHAASLVFAPSECDSQPWKCASSLVSGACLPAPHGRLPVKSLSAVFTLSFFKLCTCRLARSPAGCGHHPCRPCLGAAVVFFFISPGPKHSECILSCVLDEQMNKT